MRWYALCWLIGLLSAYFIVRRLYNEQKIKSELFEPLFIYCFVGILIGARLGHCLFYEPDYFLSSGKHIVEMLLPIRFLEYGGWKFTGYAGLASHGGTLGLIAALWLYVRRTKLPIWQVLDNIAIATPVTACFIRRDYLDIFKKMNKNKEMTDDEYSSYEQTIEKTVTRTMEAVEKATAEKEKELMTV